MTIYFYEISKIIIHDIHNDKEIEIEYLRLIFLLCEHLQEFLHFVPRAWRHGTPSVTSWYPERDVAVPKGTRPVIHGTQNVDSLNYKIFLHTYYAMKFCPFSLPL